MDRKTLSKLQRRLEVLPLHHIDTSVILATEKTEDGRACKRYLQKVGYNFRGKLSLPVLGELFLVLSRIGDYESRLEMFDNIERTIDVRKIEFYMPKSISSVLEDIRRVDERMDPVDSEIVACATEDNAVIFVTLDKKLVHNEKIENEFAIKIRHPNELL